ncbi:amino acid transporter, partial [bacterium F11]
MDDTPPQSRSPLSRPLSKTSTAIIVTSAMLSFISFWRAAAVVLCDLASSAYYVGGIAEKSIGKAAPWFVLGVMLFANLVRIVYIESCAMFVRGGVYKTVRTALGSNMAKVAVSALMFDYILTGPISSVSAGHYLASFINFLLPLVHIPWRLPENQSSMLIAIIITLYFWRKNIMGIEESSEKSLKIMKWTGVMVIMIIVWSLITIFIRGAELPPFKPQLSDHALGWFQDIPWIRTIGLFGIIIGMGHSILAMSGEESLAQVYRDIESPKLKNLIRAGIVISVFSILFTALATFFAVMIIPDDVRVSEYGKNLIVGLAGHLAGPASLKFLFKAFVVVMGAVILGGAVNTA